MSLTIHASVLSCPHLEAVGVEQIMSHGTIAATAAASGLNRSVMTQFESLLAAKTTPPLPHQQHWPCLFAEMRYILIILLREDLCGDCDVLQRGDVSPYGGRSSKTVKWDSTVSSRFFTFRFGASAMMAQETWRTSTMVFRRSSVNDYHLLTTSIDIAFAFDYSAKRLTAFADELAEDVATKQAMES
ncbi:hypothetical protein MAR_028010 [Mya arenaria]|uniref:Uncharacterized protein n=1 Tax=Mya arenaria TaxID=6604 RepID=A0ABY7DG50_MYAAR|nr:hypothetical protein MAR_028010 [Mya arenaria]